MHWYLWRIAIHPRRYFESSPPILSRSLYPSALNFTGRHGRKIRISEWWAPDLWTWFIAGHLQPLVTCRPGKKESSKILDACSCPHWFTPQFQPGNDHNLNGLFYTKSMGCRRAGVNYRMGVRKFRRCTMGFNCFAVYTYINRVSKRRYREPTVCVETNFSYRERLLEILLRMKLTFLHKGIS